LPHYWIPNSPNEVKKEMLKVIGVSDVLELFKDIPKELILNRELRIGFGKSLSEYETLRITESILSKNRVFKNPPPFVGGTVCPHYVPAIVREIVSRAEFYTAYTPYQAEISQGLLQALFEYQSLMAELYGVDVVNASMYDGSTAAAEAVRMALRITRKRKILVPKLMDPQYLEVIKTWVYGLNVRIDFFNLDLKNGKVDVDSLMSKLSDKDVACVYIENPSYYGFLIKNVKEVSDIVHDYKSLMIVNADPISLGIFEAPGKYGADIVVGEGQPLGLGLNYGGPYLGILGTKIDMKFLRQLPGRLIGATKTIDGSETAFTMILQTREQHIRRERATSNITTNTALSAIAAAVYVSLLGSRGLRELSEVILYRTMYALRRLSSVEGVKAPLFGGIYFKKIPFKLVRGDLSELNRYLLEKGIHGGKDISKYVNEPKSCLICVTEVHTESDIDLFIEHLKGYLCKG